MGGEFRGAVVFGLTSARHLLEAALAESLADPWGPAAAPDPYRLVPTLGALTGLLSAYAAGRPLATPDTVLDTIRRGLEFLAGAFGRVRASDLPDTVAVEFLVPALIEEVSVHTAPASPARSWQTDGLHQAVQGFLNVLHTRHQRLAALRTRAGSGGILPPQVVFSPEVFPEPPLVLPSPDECGLISTSPSSTCSTLARQSRADAERVIASLTELQNRLDGALPALAPMTVPEWKWMVGNTARLHHPVSPQHISPYRSVARHGPPGPGDRTPAARAIRTATDFLARHWQAGPEDPLRTPLWHAKELFEPTRVVHSLVLTRLSLASGGKPWTS
ncbi:hypothetical protein ABGB16_17490 [Micromonospora sp. B11E3]|uniref:hypothetical protein n=1 Tax=Micromonospora sp. B11E3 TaxID=3153562 RepID=UPI00325EDB6C